MAGRTVEAIKVEGIQQLLDSTLLRHRTPQSQPENELINQLTLNAVEALKLSQTMVGENTVVFGVIRYPSSGPANWGLLLAINPRSPVDRTTGQPYFCRQFTDATPSAGVMAWTQADEELVGYCVQQFGRPQLVN